MAKGKAAVKTFLAGLTLPSCTPQTGDSTLALRPEISAPRSGQKRRGRGFTLQELKEADIGLADARWMAIPIDERRCTSHPENVALLKDYLKRISKIGKEAKVPKPKPKQPTPEARPSKATTAAIQTDLAELPGITKKMAEDLAAAGVTSIRSLSTTSPHRLSRLMDLKRDRAEKVVDSAKSYMRDKSRKAREEKPRKPQITELKHLPDITHDHLRTLKELGVESLEGLKDEDPRDLSLLTGIPESQIKAWIKIIRGL
jgi:predicted flap endonuclease-1-like 5' DNA nuclease